MAEEFSFDKKLGPSPDRAPFVWSALPVSLLVKYRDDILKCLPPTELDKFNMEQELLLQFHCIRELQNDVISDETIPVNQRAQVANSVASVLNKIAEMQVEVYTSERFKNIENLLVRTLNKLPENLAAEFLTEYEKVIHNSR